MFEVVSSTQANKVSIAQQLTNHPKSLDDRLKIMFKALKPQKVQNYEQ